MENSKTIKIGIIGVGYLGEFHIQKMQIINNIQIVGFSDLNRARSSIIEKIYNIKFYKNKSTLIELCDGIVIATPTNTHYEIAAEVLSQSSHVFIEKPITTTINEANRLIELAGKNKLFIQVGHIERFNSAFVSLKEKILIHSLLKFIVYLH